MVCQHYPFLMGFFYATQKKHETKGPSQSQTITNLFVLIADGFPILPETYLYNWSDEADCVSRFNCFTLNPIRYKNDALTRLLYGTYVRKILKLKFLVFTNPPEDEHHPCCRVFIRQHHNSTHIILLNPYRDCNQICWSYIYGLLVLPRTYWHPLVNILFNGIKEVNRTTAKTLDDRRGRLLPYGQLIRLRPKTNHNGPVNLARCFFNRVVTPNSFF